MLVYTTSNEEDYFYDMPFSYDLQNYAKKNGIRLGEFQKCNEIKHIKEPSHYIVTFSRVNEKGFNEKVTAMVTEDNGSFKFYISADPIC